MACVRNATRARPQSNSARPVRFTARTMAFPAGIRASCVADSGGVEKDKYRAWPLPFTVFVFFLSYRCR